MKLSFVAASLTLLFANTFGAPPGPFCSSVTNEISRHNAQSAATVLCSFQLASDRKTKTVTVTRSTTVTETISDVVTRTSKDTYTISFTATASVSRGSSTTTIRVTSTSVLPNSSYTCFLFATPTPALGVAIDNDASASSWIPAWKGRTLVSVCECMVGTSPTHTVTETTTSTFTHYRTETSTSVVSASKTHFTYTTSTFFVTVPPATTLTSTTTATAGPDVTFRISLDFPPAVPTEKPLYMVPLTGNSYDLALSGTPLEYGGSVFDFTLTEQCKLFSHATKTAGNQTSDPYFIFFGTHGEPVTCQIDMIKSPHRLICQNPYGGNLTEVFADRYYFDNRVYYPLVLGNSTTNETGPDGGPAKIYAMFESNNKT